MDILSAFPLLSPQGPIALAERGLMVTATLFMLIVIVPVFGLLFFFAWRYRAGNKKSRYAPDWEYGRMEELVWWAIPLEIVLILGALTWTSTQQLDPRKPLPGAEPLVVQVVALEWKWLFIYPKERLASVNYLALPVGRPVRFEVTADAPMNSFWIPQLGGQIYAMTGMVTLLHLQANNAGIYKGLSANYSGEGFARMRFTAEAMSEGAFAEWIRQTKDSPAFLDNESYRALSAPSLSEPLYYGSVNPTLYDTIVATFNGGRDGTNHGTH
jgi:cytochrome o ubiquinol oxidase subunit 2